MPASFAQFEHVEMFRPSSLAAALTLPTFRSTSRNSSITADEWRCCGPRFTVLVVRGFPAARLTRPAQEFAVLVFSPSFLAAATMLPVRSRTAWNWSLSAWTYWR
ncbi:hypothetical protein ASPU41_14365 [Arthrobacter sp. U41]|nr:hypothetical protein ASPU41_14365 [Arthrobacter sp. U41]